MISTSDCGGRFAEEVVRLHRAGEALPGLVPGLIGLRGHLELGQHVPLHLDRALGPARVHHGAQRVCPHVHFVREGEVRGDDPVGRALLDLLEHLVALRVLHLQRHRLAGGRLARGLAQGQRAAGAWSAPADRAACPRSAESGPPARSSPASRCGPSRGRYPPARRTHTDPGFRSGTGNVAATVPFSNSPVNSAVLCRALRFGRQQRQVHVPRPPAARYCGW